MDVLEKLNISPAKIIENKKLSDFIGGNEYGCCYLFCDGEYMDNCGLDGLETLCWEVPVPDENCSWISGSCDQC